jgi:hypothetical protein
LLDALDAAGKSYGVTNIAASLHVILDIFERHRTDLQEGWRDGDAVRHKSRVPLESVFGVSDVSSGTAMTLHRALEKARKAGDVDDDLSHALESWAAAYLADE